MFNENQMRPQSAETTSGELSEAEKDRISTEAVREFLLDASPEEWQQILGVDPEEYEERTAQLMTQFKEMVHRVDADDQTQNQA